MDERVCIMDKETEKSELPALLMQRLSDQGAFDAENLSKPVFIPYRVSWGHEFRRHLTLSAKTRLGIGVGVAAAYAYCGNLVFEHGVTMAAVPYLLVGSVLFVLCALLVQDDRMYLDRLSFIIPSRNPILFNSKVLWSRVEELSIVDLAKSGENSKFAIRLREASGEDHDILVSALDRDCLLQLAETIELYAPHIKGLVLLRDLERFHDFQHKKLEGVSYTQLWESGAALSFGLTSFTPLTPGTLLQDQFKVEKQIAAGGFSAVYLVRDADNNRFVVKESVVPFNLDADLKNKAQEQFEREARLLTKLNHPQIAHVFDHFVENGRSYLRMQYIEGENLRAHIHGRKSASEAVVIGWVQELAEILTYLHELTPPLVHRDLSPDNILVGADGRLVLIDFGAANEFVGAATGTLVGKHAYMAPEQIRAAAEPRSDLYSLGACAHYCLTGRDPEPIRRSSPKAHGANVSDWCDELVKRLTNLDRDERFASSRECLNYVKKPGVTQEA
jgi:tRNA A-37 threonylcarbamoyl transferase component Bud32